MSRKACILILFTLLLISSFAQNDTIMLMKGKRVVCKNASVLVLPNNDTVIQFKNSKGIINQILIEKVFSITTLSNGETIFYKPDPNEPKDFTENQMKLFLNGKADYRKWKFSTGFFIGGIAAGAAGVNIPPLASESMGNSVSVSVGIVVPASYLLLAGNSTISEDKLKQMFPSLPDNEYYIMGVQESIRKHRMRDSFLGVIVGVNLGFLGRLASE
jgi:hypothetical protein